MWQETGFLKSFSLFSLRFFYLFFCRGRENPIDISAQQKRVSFFSFIEKPMPYELLNGEEDTMHGKKLYL